MLAIGGWAAPFIAIAIVAAAVLAGLIVADLALGPRRRDIEVVRSPLPHLALRKPARVAFDVVNRSNVRVSFGLVDSPVDTLEFPEDPIRGVVGAGRKQTVTLPAVPRDRGAVMLGPTFGWFDNPIGLIRRRFSFETAAEARVFPDLSAVERYGTLARRGRLVEAGFRKLRLRGGGGEFDSLREYGPDDEFRAIDWKASARRGKLMTQQFDVERSQTVMLVLDAGRLMTPRLGDQRKFDYAITAALSVASIAGLADDKVGVLAFAGDILEHIAPRSGGRHAAAMTQSLFDLQPRFEEADYAGAFAYLRRRQPKRSLVIFFTDMFDPVASATVLANVSVLSPRHLVLCVLMNDEAVESAMSSEPVTALHAYRMGVAASLLGERRKAAAILAQRGVGVIDVPARALTVSLINAYVEVKASNAL